MLYIKESVLNEEDTHNDYPAAAKKNAQMAIDWKEEHGRDEVEAGTPVGWARAHQLAKGENLSTDTVKRMSAFNRHRKNSSIKPELKETPWKDRGYVAWLIWGGDEGVDWAIEKSKEIDAMKESNQLKYIKPLNEAENYITDKFKVGDKIKTEFGEWEVIETDYAPKKRFTSPFIFKGDDMKRLDLKAPPTNKQAVGYKVTDGDKYPIIGFLYQYKDITKLATVGVDESVTEASKRKVHKAAKQGSYPAVIVVVQDGKVIHQEPVSTPDVAPATFNVMQERYPKAVLHLEDNTGKRLFSESVNEAKAVKVTKKEWPYVEFKDGGKTHKVEFDYEDIIDDHGNEGQDQYWLGKDDNGQEWMIDVYASRNGDVEEVHYDTIVKESVVNEAKAYKLKASEFGADTHSAAYNVKGEPTWRVHSTYAIDQVSGENNPEERDVVFFEAMPINNDIYIKIGGINNLKRTNGATVGKNFGTTIEEWKKDPKGIAKEASEFLTDATHLKWINKKARSEGQVIKWALKDDYSSVIEDLVNKSLGINEAKMSKEKIESLIYSLENQKSSWHPSSDSKKKAMLDKLKKDLSKFESVVTEGKMPNKFIGNDEIVYLKTKETSRGAHYNLYYKGHDIDLGGQSFGSEKELEDFAGNYILSNQWYNKLKHEDSIPLPEAAVKRLKFIKPLNESVSRYDYDKWIKANGKIKYPKWIKVTHKEIIAAGLMDKLYDAEQHYMSIWTNALGPRLFTVHASEKLGEKEFGKTGYAFLQRFWNDIRGYGGIFWEAATITLELVKKIQDRVANKEEVEPAYYIVKNYFNEFGIETRNSRLFSSTSDKLAKWMDDNDIQTL